MPSPCCILPVMLGWLTDLLTGKQTLRDDRGVDVLVRGFLPAPLLSSTYIDKAQRKARTKTPGQTATRAFRKFGPREYKASSAKGLILGLVFSLTSALFASLPPIFGLPWTNSIAAAILVGWLVSLLIAICFAAFDARAKRSSTRRGARTAREEHISRESIAVFNRCPTCDDLLDLASPTDDGFVQCNECGAAWAAAAWRNDGGIYRPPASNLLNANSLPWFRSPPLPVRDGRGVPVPFCHGDPQTATRSRMFEHALSKKAPPGFFVKQRFAYFAVLVSSIAIAVGAFFAADSDPFVMGAMFGVFALIVLGLATELVLTNERRKYAAADVARKLTSEGKCACCARPLRPTPSPIDHCLLCDTCGCAWKPPGTETQQADATPVCH